MGNGTKWRLNNCQNIKSHNIPNQYGVSEEIYEALLEEISLRFNQIIESIKKLKKQGEIQYEKCRHLYAISTVSYPSYYN